MTWVDAPTTPRHHLVMAWRRRRWILILLLVLAALAATAWLRWHGMPRVAMRALTNADQYELLSLQPRASGIMGSGDAPMFCGQQLLGRIGVTDPAVRLKLNDALQRGVREISDPNQVKACFNPRHGIRVTRSGVTTNFVICFECRQVQVWRGGTEIASFLTSASPQPVFDEVLQRAGVSLAAKEP
jgi:hypothetical protein